MVRKIVDYKKLSHEMADLLIGTYPDGYGDDDIITFKNGNGEIVEAVELKTTDTIYLVKISQSLSNFIASFDDAIEKELDTDVKVPEMEFDDDDDEDFNSDEVEFELNLETDPDEDFDFD